MTDEQKREMVKAFTPEKIASFKKVSRIKLWWSNADDQMLADLMATGQTKENSSRVAQLSNLIDVYDRYKYLNE
jgi:DNA polymerase III psi subunit